MIIQPFSVLILTTSGLYAAWSDLRHRRLSNLLVASTAVCGLALAIVNEGYAVFGSTMLHSVIALALGLPLFGWGLFGGGDVKYYAAVAAWFPVEQGFRLLGCVSLTGAVLAAGWLIGQRIGIIPRADSAETPNEKLPFGVAIGSGALLAALAHSQ